MTASNLSVHTFTGQCMETKYCIQVLQMVESVYVWVGGAGDTSQANLAIALISGADPSNPAVSGLLGDADGAGDLASLLTQRSKKLCYVSYNVATRDVMVTHAIQKRIVQELDKLGFFPAKPSKV